MPTSLSAAPNAIASLQFTGNAVAFYGTVSPDHADVSVTIDDKITTMPSGSASHVRVLRPQVSIVMTLGNANVFIDVLIRCSWYAWRCLSDEAKYDLVCDSFGQMISKMDNTL